MGITLIPFSSGAEGATSAPTCRSGYVHRLYWGSIASVERFWSSPYQVQSSTLFEFSSPILSICRGIYCSFFCND
uniref:Uncharacterized protein n=1 Tax=Rhizophora mucronata TaxID=61149 RepID=A0A2P2JAB5_RHIMU